MATIRSVVGLSTMAVAVVGLAAASSAARGDSTPELTSLSNALRQGWIQIGVVSGRIVLSGSRGVNYSTSSSSAAGDEELSIRMTGSDPVVSFQLTAAEYALTIDFTSANRLLVRRVPRSASSKIVPVEFRQPAGEAIVLRVGPKGEDVEYQAASLWHLLVTHPDVCREHLLPLLKGLQQDLELDKSSDEIADLLLRKAAERNPPDRRQWTRLVEQLGDEHYSVREAADRQLRDTGRVVTTFLQRLEPGKLDSEQQYRVRRILRGLSGTAGDDAPEQIAEWLSGDPEVWLAMLDRSDERTRHLASRQLAAFWDGPLTFDPDADASTRAEQIAQLRTRLSAIR